MAALVPVPASSTLAAAAASASAAPATVASTAADRDAVQPASKRHRSSSPLDSDSDSDNSILNMPSLGSVVLPNADAGAVPLRGTTRAAGSASATSASTAAPQRGGSVVPRPSSGTSAPQAQDGVHALSVSLAAIKEYGDDCVLAQHVSGYRSYRLKPSACISLANIRSDGNPKFAPTSLFAMAIGHTDIPDPETDDLLKDLWDGTGTPFPKSAIVPTTKKMPLQKEAARRFVYKGEPVPSWVINPRTSKTIKSIIEHLKKQVIVSEKEEVAGLVRRFRSIETASLQLSKENRLRSATSGDGGRVRTCRLVECILDPTHRDAWKCRDDANTRQETDSRNSPNRNRRVYEHIANVFNDEENDMTSSVIGHPPYDKEFDLLPPLEKNGMNGEMVKTKVADLKSKLSRVSLIIASSLLDWYNFALLCFDLPTNAYTLHPA